MVKNIKELSFNYNFKNKKKVYYADGWCLKDYFFNEQFNNKILNAYYKSNSKKKHYNNCKKYKKIIKKKFFKVLNLHHVVNYSDRQWEILLGHWLNRCIELLYNRFHQVDFILKNYNIEKFYLIKSNAKFSCKNSKDYILCCQDSIFNDKINFEILKFFSLEKKVHFIKKKSQIKKEINFKSNLLKSTLIKILNFIGFKNNIFVIDSYLSNYENLIFQVFYLKQFPKIWKSPILKDINEDEELRNKLSNIYNIKKKNNFLRFFLRTIFKIIPRVYLEGFKLNNKTVLESNWPKNPKLVFTANAFDTNEFFKFWLINNIKKTKYYSIQHGANYGVSKFDVNPSIEEYTSDKFITWGYKNYKTQIKGPNIKLKKKINRINDVNDNMVLFLKPSPRRDFLWNDSLEFKIHINENIKFIKSLSELNRSKLQVKKHFTKEFYNFDVKKILNLKIDKVKFSEQSYQELIKTKKLFLFINFHSTGFLETLSYNIPCIYVKDTYSEFRSDYLNDLKKLGKVNIYFNSSTKAVKFINKNYSDLYKWWNNKSVQRARKIFINKYSKNSENKLRELSNLIK